MEQSLISIPSVEDFLHVPKPRRYLVLDDKCEDADDDCVLYVGGFDEDYEEDISTEKYLARYTQGIQVMDSQGHINVTHLAYWKASSQKDGNPITCALDDNPSTFWQSDGSQPHSLEAYFSKRMEIVQLALFLSVMVDESYTPQIIKVYAGHSPSDATLYKVLEVRNVNGWIALLFGDNRPGDHLLKCQYIRLDIPINHENGKDTHLRGARIYTPSMRSPIGNSQALESFSTGFLLSGCGIR